MPKGIPNPRITKFLVERVDDDIVIMAVVIVKETVKRVQRTLMVKVIVGKCDWCEERKSFLKSNVLMFETLEEAIDCAQRFLDEKIIATHQKLEGLSTTQKQLNKLRGQYGTQTKGGS